MSEISETTSWEPAVDAGMKPSPNPAEAYNEATSSAVE
jgi:hypothetical protein